MKKIVLAILIFTSATCYGQSKKDTTKTKVDSTYSLEGVMQEFQLLYTSIVSPDDITVNQKKYLIAWLQKLKYLPPPKK